MIFVLQVDMSASMVIIKRRSIRFKGGGGGCHCKIGMGKNSIKARFILTY